MPDTKQSALKSLLNGVAWFFFVVAGIAFWVGGRAIHEFANTERVLAEIEGIGIAALFGGFGATAKSFSRCEHSQTPSRDEKADEQHH
jgi:hypothetical protein